MNIVSLLNNYAITSCKILICSLVGFNFNILRASAEDNVLVIHSYNEELASTKQHQLGIEQGFAELGSKTNIYHEFLDNPSGLERQEEQFAEYIAEKYRRLDLDLLMVIEEPSLELVLRQRQNFFKELPVVFLGIEELSQQVLDTPWLTGVVEDRSIIETAFEATRQTWTNTVIIINDTTSRGKSNLEQIEAIEKNSYQSLKVETINNLTPQEAKARLSIYPKTIPIVLLGRLSQ